MSLTSAHISPPSHKVAFIVVVVVVWNVFIILVVIIKQVGCCIPIGKQCSQVVEAEARQWGSLAFGSLLLIMTSQFEQGWKST